MQRKVAIGLLAALALFAVSGHAGAPNVKGKIVGYEKLVPEVYAETAKPDPKHWTWREPSPSVASQFRTLSANPSRDICIAATTGANQDKQEYRLNVTGGRVFPTTIVVTPNTTIAFKNLDPFKHRVYVMSATGQKILNPEDIQANNVRSWSPQGQGIYTVKDELFPSVRTYIVVDPQVVAVAYPGRDGAFGFSLPSGDYVLKAFFNGKPVGKQLQVTASDKKVLDMKEPFKLDDGAAPAPGAAQ